MRLAPGSPEASPLPPGAQPPPLGVDETARGGGEGSLDGGSLSSGGAALTPALSQRERGYLTAALAQRERGYLAAAAALVLATVLTRLPFMTQTLYAFDSANYALAVSTFYNVAFHQPHPPGYPLYVFFARAIDLLVHDANRALVLEGILWSALATAGTIGLGRAMFGRAAGLLAGLLLVSTVGFWGYGEV